LEAGVLEEEERREVAAAEGRSGRAGTRSSMNCLEGGC
jgi:hypothetical protein